MKRIGKILLKMLLLVAIFTTTSLVLSTSGVKIVSEARADVSGKQVYMYLTDLGYQVLQLRQVQGSEDWQAYTYINGNYYLTTVYVKGDQIIDHEDSSL